MQCFNNCFQFTTGIEFTLTTLYTLHYMFFHLRSNHYAPKALTLHVPPSTLYTLYLLVYQFKIFFDYSLARLNDLPSWPIWKVIGLFHFLMKISEQPKGRFLVVVSFCIYFRCASSLSEISSENDLSMPKFNFPWK